MRKIKCFFCGADTIEKKESCVFSDLHEENGKCICEDGKITVLYCTNKECINHPDNEDKLDELIDKMIEETNTTEE